MKSLETNSQLGLFGYYGNKLHSLYPYYSIIVAGDGRYYNTQAMQIICRVLAANGVADIWIPATGIMSTPAVSAAIRERQGGQCQGGIILTASHNPGGPGEDFGIKYNLAVGQPAGEDFTDDVSGRAVVKSNRINQRSESTWTDGYLSSHTHDAHDVYLFAITPHFRTQIHILCSYTNEV
jgi:phosphoglucomutase